MNDLMEAIAVSTAVNRAGWDAPEMVEPVAAIRAFLAILGASDERREDLITFLVIEHVLMRV